MASSSTAGYQIQANTGIAIISVANPNLDGSGALSKIIDGSTAFNTSEGGTKVRRIVVKATGTTTQGMCKMLGKGNMLVYQALSNV